MERKKILVVEDEYTTRRMLSFNLKQQGYDVYEAEDGPKGFELAQTEKPDLILLDIMMPGENGFEVCKKIRSTETIAGTPILVLTARAGLADKKFALKAGADDYLTKPVGLDELNERIEQFIKKIEKEEQKTPPPEPGQIVAVFGPQRKLGTTTLATNLSEVVAKKQKHPVVLIDLVLPMGDIAAVLNLDSQKHVAELLSQPTSQLTLEVIQQYMQKHEDGYDVIAGPMAPIDRKQRPTADNLSLFLDILIQAGYIAILDLGSTLNELNFTVISAAHKVFILTSGQPAANEALDNFLSLARKLGLDLARMLPVVNQINGPIGQQVVLARTPVARLPYIKDESYRTLWTNELALQKLNTIITA